jgi:hypothetical protein
MSAISTNIFKTFLLDHQNPTFNFLRQVLLVLEVLCPRQVHSNLRLEVYLQLCKPKVLVVLHKLLVKDRKPNLKVSSEVSKQRLLLHLVVVFLSRLLLHRLLHQAHSAQFRLQAHNLREDFSVPSRPKPAVHSLSLNNYRHHSREEDSQARSPLKVHGHREFDASYPIHSLLLHQSKPSSSKAVHLPS